MIDPTRRDPHILASRARGRALVASDRRLFLLVMGLALISWTALTLAIGPGSHRLARAGDPQARDRAFVACENAVQRRAGELLRCHVVPPKAERRYRI